MRTARCAAFLALSIPTHATGTPLGTWAVASSASSPFRAPTANGTPITGRSVSEAAKPGRAADSPAPAMTTRKPFVRAFLTRSAVRSGCRCADETWNSYETPALDRKSTRLNSSHLVISYAVFCLKKKKNHSYVQAFVGIGHALSSIDYHFSEPEVVRIVLARQRATSSGVSLNVAMKDRSKINDSL